MRAISCSTVRPATWLWIAGAASTALAQNPLPAQKLDTPPAPEQAFHSGILEARRGTILTYRQAYRSDHQHVSLDGTLFVVMDRFEAKDCQVRIQTSATDIYYGTIGRKIVPGTQAVHRSSAQFRLSPALADSLHIVEKRPAQLHVGTHPACEERSDCTIPWLEIQTDRPVIKIENTTDDVEGYDGFVKNAEGLTTRFDIPLDSVEAANALAVELKQMASVCGR